MGAEITHHHRHCRRAIEMVRSLWVCHDPQGLCHNKYSRPFAVGSTPVFRQAGHTPQRDAPTRPRSQSPVQLYVVAAGLQRRGHVPPAPPNRGVGTSTLFTPPPRQRVECCPSSLPSRLAPSWSSPNRKWVPTSGPWPQVVHFLKIW